MSNLLKVATSQLFVLCVFVSCIKETLYHTMPLNEEAFVISTNLSNPYITAFSEDAFGHIWIGTDRGLNRYNGKEYYQYYRSEQPNSIVNSTILNFYTDSKGRHWNISYGGACHYDTDDTFRRSIMNVDLKGSLYMIETHAGSLVLVTQMASILKFKEDTYEFNQLFFEQDLPPCVGLYPAAGDAIWYVGSHEVLLVDIGKSEVIRSYSYPENFQGGSSVLNDNDHILIYSSLSAICFSMLEETFLSAPQWIHDIRKKSSMINNVYIGSKINVIVTDVGTWFYDRYNGHLFHETDNGSPYKMPVVKPSVIFIDSRDNLWIGSHGKGMFMVPASGNLFNQNHAQTSVFEGENISSIARDSDDGLWVISEGMLCYSSKKGETCEVSLSDLGITGVYDVFMTYNLKRNSIWIASGEDVLCFDVSNQEGELRLKGSHHISGRKVRGMKSSDDGKVYFILGNGEFYSCEESDSQNIEVKYEAIFPESRGLIYDMLFLRNGKIALSMFMKPIIIYDPVTGIIQEVDYRKHIGEKFHVISLAEDIMGRLWFGTRDYGLYRLEEDKCVQIKGISSQAISSIEHDRFGNLWISTGEGISRYDIRTDDIINFTSKNGLINNNFNRRCSCVMSDGEVVFGGSEGVVTCHNIDIETDKKYNIVFQNIKINNDYAYPVRGGNIESIIFNKPQVRLNYDQNNIAISFALMDYRPYHTANYRFKLEGQDDTWTKIGNDNVIYFSHLRPGRYILKVDAETLDKDSVNGAEMDIVVYNPWWFCTIAKIIYAILAIGFIYIIVGMFKKELISEMELERAKNNFEQEKILHKMSYNLFGNISHDFRSPLTMLAGSVSQFALEPNRSEYDYRLISAMQKGIDRLNRLVNQLLDFNKMESGVLKLKLKRGYDMNAKLKEIIEMSLVYAKYRNIEMKFSGCEGARHVHLDPEKFDSIISNLISNAFKFVKVDEGKINIEVYEISSDEIASMIHKRDDDKSEEYVCIKVENNGLPISLEDIGKVFDRYYQIKRHGENIRRVGSGIGLSFAKALAELHHGYLWTENMANDEGVRFSLALPLDESVYSAEEFDDEPADTQMNDMLCYSGNPNSENENKAVETVMVIDDDVDVANYLSLILESRYKVICCYDAEKALAIIKSGRVPDIILSDVMMPGMDGIEFCSQVKAKAATCRIPVVLVTAKSDVETKVEGLEYGADAYMTKPFEPSLLMAQISSLLKNRILSKGYEYELADILNIDVSNFSESDKVFIKRIVDIMKNNLSNPDLDVAFLCNELKISRSKMFYKIKEIFDVSPNELLKRYRMEEALRLLNEGKYNVSEVAYSVGFYSLSYFSKTFKQQFGKLPKDVKGN